LLCRRIESVLDRLDKKERRTFVRDIIYDEKEEKR